MDTSPSDKQTWQLTALREACLRSFGMFVVGRLLKALALFGVTPLTLILECFLFYSLDETDSLLSPEPAA